MLFTQSTQDMARSSFSPEWAWRDSNPRPSDYESPALTAELQAPCQTPRQYVARNRMFLQWPPRKTRVFVRERIPAYQSQCLAPPQSKKLPRRRRRHHGSLDRERASPATSQKDVNATRPPTLIRRPGTTRGAIGQRSCNPHLETPCSVQ